MNLPRRGFRKLLLMVVGVASLLVMGAGSEEVETRIFSGSGSRSVTSDVELFVVGGTYEHQLETAGCFAAAGLFPAERLPRVKLREVLSADLSAGTSESSLGQTMPFGTFTITAPGWATLQIGTGPECSWSYSIRGEFLPPGDEPGPPRAPGSLQRWEILLFVLGIASLAAFVARRGVSAGSDTSDADKIRTLPAAPEEHPRET